ncbi:Deleted in malignant brain tumors 1 protein, partial [Geodia barretti]
MPVFSALTQTRPTVVRRRATGRTVPTEYEGESGSVYRRCLEGTVCGESRHGYDREASWSGRQLGLPNKYSIAVGDAAFGPGEGLVLIRSMQCNGSESALLNCRYSTPSPFSFFCRSHSSDASVVCHDPTFRCNSTEVRLGGGATPNEGRVEICLDNHWGTLCDNGWDLPDAQVVCRQLGYRPEGAITARARRYGEGFGRVHLDNLNCSGSEERLYDCQHSSFTEVTCFSFESDVGVVCPVGDPVCTHGDLRLQDGDTLLEGRVEICIGGTWGSVCDDLWDDRDAAVACSQLGFSRIGADAAGYRTFPVATADVPILLDNLQCVGTESSLLDCRATPIGTHNCGHHEDAGIYCRPRPCIDGTLRLNDGFNPSNGRLEICVNEVWATVCGTGFTDEMAAAACTGMGLPSDGAFRSAEGLFGSPSSEGPFYVVDIQCPPARPTNCTFTTATPPGTCTHENDVGVFCPVAEGTPTLCTTGDIRLAGTFRPQQGRVEICINNQWGTICDDSWNQHSVNFVCTSLYDQSIVGEMVDPEEFSGGEDLPILMDDVKCRGTESNLLSCPQLQLNASHDCTHMEDVAISCNGTRRCRDGEIMLAGGQYESEGTIQICIDDVWGTVCDDLWDQTDAGVVCNVLGYTNGSAIALRGAHFGEGTGPIHLDNVICTGSENSLLDCRYSPHNCGHYEDAGVICPAPQDADTNCTNGEVRLADGDNEYQGRVEVCLHGNWGTVCDDRWDNRDARVVCNQLGYTGGVPFSVTRAGFGRGSGLIFLDNVDCDGTEPNLLQCRGNEPGNHNCGPSEDAGVYCP